MPCFRRVPSYSRTVDGELGSHASVDVPSSFGCTLTQLDVRMQECAGIVPSGSQKKGLMTNIHATLIAATPPLPTHSCTLPVYHLLAVLDCVIRRRFSGLEVAGRRFSSCSGCFYWKGSRGSCLGSQQPLASLLLILAGIISPLRLVCLRSSRADTWTR